MLIRIEDIKDLCNKILAAVDTSELSQITETLQLKTDNNFLYLSVTNHEYYAQVKFDMKENVELNATVNAKLFLNLISNTTSDVVELKTTDKTLIVKSNGTYKLPLIYDGDKLLNIPKIEINNVTSSFNIDSNILQSIVNYNGKEMQSGIIKIPVQKLYYVDGDGAITFNTGACVNKFKLEKPIKMLLSGKIVKLFKLFKSGSVLFSMGHDALDNGNVQTKVCFTDGVISITAIISSDENLMASVPVTAIRGIADKNYDYSVTLNKIAFLDAIKRLTLFIDKGIRPWCNIHFSSDAVTISDANNDNSEDVFYDGDKELDCDYSAMINLFDLKTTIESCNETHITISFGDHRAFVISRGNIYNIIPETV